MVKLGPSVTTLYRGSQAHAKTYEAKPSLSVRARGRSRSGTRPRTRSGSAWRRTRCASWRGASRRCTRPASPRAPPTWSSAIAWSTYHRTSPRRACVAPVWPLARPFTLQHAVCASPGVLSRPAPPPTRRRSRSSALLPRSGMRGGLTQAGRGGVCRCWRRPGARWRRAARCTSRTSTATAACRTPPARTRRAMRDTQAFRLRLCTAQHGGSVLHRVGTFQPRCTVCPAPGCLNMNCMSCLGLQCCTVASLQWTQELAVAVTTERG